MNLTRLALRRPFTVLVCILAVLLSGGLAYQQIKRDILPSLGVPTIYVAQPFGGMDPAQMEGNLTYYYEYHFLYVTGIEHVESKSIQGNALIKLQFHPGTDMNQAMAETVAMVNRARAFMPPGTVAPFTMRFDAGSVAVGNLVFMSDTLSIGELADVGLNRVRPMFSALPGVSAPPPFGGSARAILIKADPDKLRAYHMTPDELVSAIASANALTPSGNVRIGDVTSMVPMNSTVVDIRDLETVPVRTGTFPAVMVRDVATVSDGSDITTAYANVNGRRAVYIPVTKRADASTLEVIERVKANLPRFQAAVPDSVKVSFAFDQSPFIVHAIDDLSKEALIGAVLTGLMVLLFLADLRSALIVIITIPIALFASLEALWLVGQTLNLMTLAGLALAVGVLVDEATVTIENVHVHRAQGKSVARAALDATSETAIPRLMAMLCILAVFIPAFMLVGPGKALFVPLALAVGFAMAASYLLSCTLVPVLAAWLLPEHTPARRTSLVEHLGNGLAALLRPLIALRWAVIPVYVIGASAGAWLLSQHLGHEIFPSVDTGQFQVRLHAPIGTRIEKTEQLTQRAGKIIEETVGKDAVEISIAFIGTQPPSFPVNLIHAWTSGPEEAILQIGLKPGVARPGLDALKEQLRQRFAAQLPEVACSFEPSDVLSRVMSFGSPTPIEIAVAGPDLKASREFAEQIMTQLRKIAPLRDLQYGQSFDYPTVAINVDRERAGMMGVTMAQAARSVVAATSSSRFTTPVYWADPKTGQAFQVQVSIPEDRMNSLEEVRNIPVAGNVERTTLLRDIAQVSTGTAIGEYDRYNMERMVTINANIAGADLGSVARDVRTAIAAAGPVPAKMNVNVRGQIAPMESLFSGLTNGLIITVIVIGLLLLARFQSFSATLAVISTVPAVLLGVAVMLNATGTTINIQSLMGAIMAIGIATANAILLVTRCTQAHLPGVLASSASITGARSRLRPILMTSFAMIAGMIPLALGIGQGGEQTAPLGRAVIGGLLGATFATLVIVPCVFAARGAARGSRSLDPDGEREQTQSDQRSL